MKWTQDISWEYYSDSLSDNHNIWIRQVYQCWNVLSMLLLTGFNCWSTLRCGKCTTTDQGNCSDAVFLTMWFSTKLIVTMGSFHRQMVRIYIGKFLKDARIEIQTNQFKISQILQNCTPWRFLVRIYGKIGYVVRLSFS